MLIDQPIPEPLAPIQRQTPEQRLATFDKESNSIYKKYSVYDQNTGPGLRFGSKQPFVYITVGSNNSEKTITNADSQAMPFGSTLLDVKRVSKFATSATGVLYIGKQYLLQKQNAYNETRIYNPLSLISATAAKGSTGLIERPVRFLPTSGGVGNFIGNSLLSLVGIQSKDIEAAPDGTATGAAISSYVKMAGSTTSKGLLRYESGDSGRNRFGTYFPAPGADPTQGPTRSLGSAIAGALINKLKSFIPSTNPFGFGGSSNNKWEIRPEYKGATGAYEAMYADKGGLLAIANTPPNAGSSSSGFVDTIVGSLKNAIFGKSPPAPLSIGKDALQVSMYHRYTPTQKYYFGQSDGQGVAASRANTDPKIQNINVLNQLESLKTPKASTNFVQKDNSTERLKEVKDSRGRLYKTYTNIGVGKTTYTGATANNLLPSVTSSYEQEKFDKLISAIQSWDENVNNIRSRPSTERLKTIKDYSANDKEYTPYSKIDPKNGFAENTIRNAGIDTSDKFFVYPSLKKSYSLNPKSTEADIYDKYNAIDGPINGERPEKDGEPEEIRGGAGQSKDVIFFYFYDLVNEKYIPFRATVNSISEANSVEWDPVQYLGRPDKLYLYKGFERTLSFGFTAYANSLRELVPMWKRINYLVGLARPPKYTEAREGNNSNISSFMYPPMVTFRLGDMYYDQPAVLSSISISIPDDAGMWETYRGKGDEYNYLYGIDGVKNVIKYDASVKSLQLPTKADISVSMNLMEKDRSQTDADHFYLSGVDKL
jgi:hypothetical protein